jgi:RNA polymerase sigma-70 factor (ECF subfamily)
MTDFSALYKKYAPDVFRFALYLSGHRADAEDITSETFARAWASSGRIEMTSVKGYLFAIARNLFLQGLRKKNRNVELSDDLRDSQASPYVQAEQKQELRVVLAVLQQLPEIDRAALLMRASDDVSYEEIARALAITVASAKVKIHRARLKLAEFRHVQNPPGNLNQGEERK